MTSAHLVVAAYWAAAEARDWEKFADLVAEHVVYEAPQTRERVRGRAAYVRFNVEGFPGDWHMAVERIVGEDRHAASWIQFTGENGPQPGLCFFDLDDEGRIARITDFWPDPYELPASRAHLVERYSCNGPNHSETDREAVVPVRLLVEALERDRPREADPTHRCRRDEPEKMT